MARRGGEGRIRFANQTALYFLLFAFSSEEKVSKRREESVKLICREKGKEEERKEEKRKGEGENWEFDASACGAEDGRFPICGKGTS